VSQEFLSINDAKTALKGSIKGVIIEAKDLKSGTTKTGKDWTRKDFTIEDKSGSVRLTAWGEDTNKFKLGYTYEIVQPQWKKHEDVPQVQPSKYGSFKCIGTAANQEQINESTTKTAAPETDSLPKLDASIRGTINENTILMLQIEQEVKGTFNDLELPDKDNGNKIGMFVRTFYEEYKRSKVTDNA